MSKINFKINGDLRGKLIAIDSEFDLPFADNQTEFSMYLYFRYQFSLRYSNKVRYLFVRLEYC